MQGRLSSSLSIMLIASSAAFAALSTAWISQYGFGLYPCELCLYQRLPYIGALSLTLLSTMPVVDASARRLAAYTAALLFLATASVAFFHVGVEQEWWSSSCAPSGTQSFSFDDIRLALQQPGQPACDEVQFTLFGISIAGYNIAAGLLFSSWCLWAARTDRFWQDA
jgi:disulfide bond formation protein DsbB